ncbi:MAG: DNA repair protein RadC [Desulfoplanes sp.]|nr:DNA repair protein RadC [Desulfoplanes sp.]MDD4648419.1 DNA repair protein RadC [Desulfoplanes sp.]
MENQPENQLEKPHYLEHRKRLKKRFWEQPVSLADYEVLELLLGYVIPRRDTKPLAKELIKHFGGVEDVFNAREAELKAVPGIGEGTLLFFRLIKECRARKAETPLKRKIAFTSPADVSAMVISRLGNCEREEFWTILVDNKNRLQAFEKISQGTVDQAPVFPREILALALQWKSSGLILVHNHPGGDPTPSSQDIQLTNKLKSLGKELGVRVLDHLVVAEASHYSFIEHGLL